MNLTARLIRKSFAQGILLLSLSLCYTLNAGVVYLDNLNASEFEIGNLLEWSTESEDNSDKFFIEKSIDGSSFNEIGAVDAANISTQEKYYSFLDISASEDKSFYRLRQVDLDGTASYSPVIGMQKNLLNQFAIVHMTNTEVKDDFTVTLESSVPGELMVTLNSYQGSNVYTSSQPLIPCTNEVFLSFKDYND